MSAKSCCVAESEFVTVHAASILRYLPLLEAAGDVRAVSSASLAVLNNQVSSVCMLVAMCLDWLSSPGLGFEQWGAVLIDVSGRV